jgi:hypothetical protein
LRFFDLRDGFMRCATDQSKRLPNRRAEDGSPREESVIWKKVFTELWTDRISKSQVAADLHLPADELENLVFGQTGAITPIRAKGPPDLKAV